MTLPPKSLQVLVDLKRKLLQQAECGACDRGEAKRDFSSRIPRNDGVRKAERKVTAGPANHPAGRHARGTTAFQRGCQRREWWAPVY